MTHDPISNTHVPYRNWRPRFTSACKRALLAYPELAVEIGEETVAHAPCGPRSRKGIRIVAVSLASITTYIVYLDMMTLSMDRDRWPSEAFDRYDQRNVKRATDEHIHDASSHIVAAPFATQPALWRDSLRFPFDSTWMLDYELRPEIMSPDKSMFPDRWMQDFIEQQTMNVLYPMRQANDIVLSARGRAELGITAIWQVQRALLANSRMLDAPASGSSVDEFLGRASTYTERGDVWRRANPDTEVGVQVRDGEELDSNQALIVAGYESRREPVGRCPAQHPADVRTLPDTASFKERCVQGLGQCGRVMVALGLPVADPYTTHDIESLWRTCVFQAVPAMLRDQVVAGTLDDTTLLDLPNIQRALQPPAPIRTHRHDFGRSTLVRSSS